MQINELPSQCYMREKFSLDTKNFVNYYLIKTENFRKKDGKLIQNL